MNIIIGLTVAEKKFLSLADYTVPEILSVNWKLNQIIDSSGTDGNAGSEIRVSSPIEQAKRAKRTAHRRAPTRLPKLGIYRFFPFPAKKPMTRSTAPRPARNRGTLKPSA